jgi:sugar phosphate isomerase/epimerase
MRPIGFSTGSLCRGDFQAALDLLSGAGTDAVELSALRAWELPDLASAADTLALDGFDHVSVHAPSSFGKDVEPDVLRLLMQLCDHGWGIVVHPDTIDPASDPLWRELGSSLWIENMDKRKPVGRSAAELEGIFERFPDAGLCFDIAHARQYDPSMLETYRILHAHGPRLREVHLSEVASSSKHTRLSFGAIHDFSEAAHWIPPHVPVIIESPVSEGEIANELERALQALPVPGGAGC